MAQPTKRPTKHQEQRLVEAWNDKHPVGTRVLYWMGRREGTGYESRTSTRAQLLSGHTAVVWVEGHSACIALSHIEADE